MISKKLLNPESIVIVGGSDDESKPGGAVLRNLLDSSFKGPIYVVNPKSAIVKGMKTFTTVNDLPQVDLAVLAIPARLCTETVKVLANKKGTGGFIILSAGFSEETREGAIIEKEIVSTIESKGGSLIGPNCIGFLNNSYNGTFTRPVPELTSGGIDFISGSGATAVFIMEVAVQCGLSFSSVWSVGNSAQIGVEDVLEHLDDTFDPEKSSRIKLLYVESISRPDKLLRHASSLINKGCRIAAIKAGGSEAGSRAASSHTGAMASSDVAVDALFRKAGIVRCSSRTMLATVASLFTYKPLNGKRVAIVTHAGGPAVMLTDALSNGGLEVPHIEGEAAKRLLSKLFPGSSVANPIDFLATGTAQQLGEIIDACENDFDNVDAMAVIFGSPGLFSVDDVYSLLDEKIRSCKKPVYPILPSIMNVRREIDEFIAKGNAVFTDETLFGKALSKVCRTPAPSSTDFVRPQVNKTEIRKVIDNANNGYLAPEDVRTLLVAAGISCIPEAVVSNADDAVRCAQEAGFPVVMKVVGPVHKSDVGGVVLNVTNAERVRSEFARMMKIHDVKGVLIQKMISGAELFCGAKREEKFGHLLMAGMGGIFIEVYKDVASGLVPVSVPEAASMIRSLKSYKIIKGIRGGKGVDEPAFAEVITRLSALLECAPEIFEMDINPLLATEKVITAVDARIRIERI
jgi:acetate---CoA ligase (ADP-forming)